MVNSADFRLRGHIHSRNINKCHVMKTMPSDHNEFKLRFNTHSSHICLHMASLSVTWCKQRSRDVNIAMWLSSLSLGLVRIAAIFVHIKVTEPSKPVASSLRRKLCPSATNLTDSPGIEPGPPKPITIWNFTAVKNFTSHMLTLGTLNYLRTFSAAYVKKGD
jgi:hypothetical protein